MKFLITVFLYFVLSVISAFAQPSDSRKYDQAEGFYNQTEYEKSLKLLFEADCEKSGRAIFLAGQNYFQLENYHEAISHFKSATRLDPSNSSYFNWLGRAYGRLAEKNSNPFSSFLSVMSGAKIGNATKAKLNFEKAVELDGENLEALSDLFLFYLYAPKILGGGEARAREIIRRIYSLDETEGRWAEAVYFEKQKKYDTAERYFKAAIRKDSKEPSRYADLAEFYVKCEQLAEALRSYEKFLSKFPNNPRLIFDFAQALIDDGADSSLTKAVKLLERYITIPLTPDDPPKKNAQELLGKLK